MFTTLQTIKMFVFSLLIVIRVQTLAASISSDKSPFNNIKKKKT